MKSQRKLPGYEKQESIFVPRPYTHKELAQLYRVSWVTLQRWLKPHRHQIGRKEGHFYRAQQVLTILRLVGIPKAFALTLQELDEIERRLH